MSNPSNRASMRGQLTLRGVVIGVLGCVIITASSAYTALKMGALPWPIIFAAVISLFFLKLMGNASLNEANVTHTIMSAGALVAAAVMVALVTAYGPDAYGPDKSCVAAQASVVATMVSGIPSVPWFVGGFIAGIVMYWLGIPAMMIGLGVYLPFYMSLTAFLGSCVKLAYDKWSAHRDATAGLSDEERAAKDAAFQEQGLVVASGLLGGESIVGVILAFISVGLSLLG